MLKIALIMLCLGLWTSGAQATTYWDEEFTSLSAWDTSASGSGVFTIDSSVFYSGASSVRLDYPSVCATNSLCGGSLFRTYPDSGTLYARYYIRLSTGFAVSTDAYTKLHYFGTDQLASNGQRYLLDIATLGCCGSKVFKYHAQNSPTVGATDVLSTTATLGDAQWYCIEEHVDLNTPGVANGTYEMWVDGQLSAQRTNVSFRTSGDNSVFQWWELYRQNGVGSIWFDRIAVGDTRIGCVGAAPPADTTPPSVPTSLVATASGSSASLTWVIGTDSGGSGLASTVFTYCTGAACSPTTVLATVTSPTASYTASGLTAGTVYGFAAKSYDNAGNASVATSTVYITTGTTYRTTLGTDTFSQADENPLSSGGNWTASYTGRFAAQVVSHQVQSTSLVDDTIVVYSGATTPNDQWAQYTFSTLAAGQAEGVFVRLANSPNENGYLCQTFDTTARILKFTTGSGAALVTNSAITAFAATDTLRCEAEGTTIRMYKVTAAGVATLLTSTTDATYASGKTGMQLYSSPLGLVSVSSFAMGGFSVTPPTPPAILTLSTSGTGLTETDSGSPTSYKLVYGSNDGLTTTTVILSSSSIVAGAYTIAWPVTTQYACLYAIDALGVVNTTTYVCAGVTPAATNHGPATGVLHQLSTTPWLTNSSGKGLYYAGLSGVFNTMQDYAEDGVTPALNVTTHSASMQASGLNFIRNFIFEETATGTAGEFSGNTYQRVPYTQMPYTAVSTRSDSSSGTAITVGVYDLTQWNQAFFDRVRSTVLTQLSYGITPSVQLFYGWAKFNRTYNAFSHPFYATNNVNGVSCDANASGSCEEAHTLSNTTVTAYQDAFVKKMIDTLNDIDGFVWEIANEDNNSTQLAWQNHIADTITTYEAAAGRKVHPVWNTGMALTPDNAGLLSNTHVTLVSLICDGTTNYETSPPASAGTKILLYDSDHSGTGCGTETVAVPWKLFTRGYHAISLNLRESAGVQANLITTMAQTISYANRMDMTTLLPVTGTSIISTGYGLKHDCAEYLMYMPSDGSSSIDLSGCSAALSFTVEFFDPITGVTTSSTAVAGGASRSWNPTGTDPMAIYLKLTPVVDTTPPTIFGCTPTGVQPLGTTQVSVQCFTNENATVSYGGTVFTVTGGTTHTLTVGGLTNGLVVSQNINATDTAGNVTVNGATVSFSIAGQADMTPPVMSNAQPITTLPAGTTSALISFAVNEAATCKYDTSDTTYTLMANAMSVTNLVASATVSGLTNGSTHTYYARCQDVAQPTPNADTQSILITVTVASSTVDVTAPSTVAGLTVVVTGLQASLTWTAATDAGGMAGYWVYRCAVSDCSDAILAQQLGNTTTTVYGLSYSSTVYFAVKAIDTSNNLSAAFSNIVTATTTGIVDIIPPSTMTNLRVLGVFSQTAVLSSDPGTDDRGAVTTTIEVSAAGCNNFVLVYSKLTLEASIYGLTPNTSYCARGKFSDGANLSVAYSNTVTFTTTTGAHVLTRPRGSVPFGQPRTPRN